MKTHPIMIVVGGLEHWNTGLFVNAFATSDTLAPIAITADGDIHEFLCVHYPRLACGR